MIKQLQPEESNQLLRMSSSGDISSPEALEQLFQQLISQLPMNQNGRQDIPSFPEVSSSVANNHASSIKDAQQLVGKSTGISNVNKAPANQNSTSKYYFLPEQTSVETLRSTNNQPQSANELTGTITPLVGETQKQQENFLQKSQDSLKNPPNTNTTGEEMPNEAQLLQLFTQSIHQAPLDESQLHQTLTEPLGTKPPIHGKNPNFYFLPNFSAATPLEPAQAGGISSEAFDVEAVRQDFPALHQQINGKSLIWMDNAATSQKPQIVIDALAHFYQNDNSNVHRGAHTLAARATNAYEEAREKIQRFLGASLAKEIIYVRGTTEGINLVAQTYGRKEVKAGDEIIVSTLEHHSNIVPWQMLAQEKSAVLKAIPINDRGEVILEEYEKLLSEKTRIVALSHVSNVLGTVLPIKTMTEMAHRYGAVVLVDGAQSVPHLRINVQDLDADFFVFSGHKLFAPTGIGVLYGKAALLEAMPPWQAGGNMIDRVSFEKTTFNDIPNKFEAGTGNIADAVGLGVAIDYLNQIGFEAAIHHEEQLLNYGIQGLKTLSGLRHIGTAPGKVSTLSFVLEGISSEDMGKFLDSEGIAVRSGHHCAQPTLQRYGLTSAVRPSLAFYNTYKEVDALIAAIEKGKKQLS